MSLKLCGYINIALFFVNGYMYISDPGTEFLTVAILNIIAGFVCLSRASKRA